VSFVSLSEIYFDYTCRPNLDIRALSGHKISFEWLRSRSPDHGRIKSRTMANDNMSDI